MPTETNFTEKEALHTEMEIPSNDEKNLIGHNINYTNHAPSAQTNISTNIPTTFVLPSHTSQNEQNLNEPRRRSMRDIKRPKFDDEIVDSAQLIQPKSTPKRRQSNEKNASVLHQILTANSTNDNMVFKFMPIRKVVQHLRVEH